MPGKETGGKYRASTIRETGKRLFPHFVRFVMKISFTEEYTVCAYSFWHWWIALGRRSEGILFQIQNTEGLDEIFSGGIVKVQVDSEPSEPLVCWLNIPLEGKPVCRKTNRHPLCQWLRVVVSLGTEIILLCSLVQLSPNEEYSMVMCVIAWWQKTLRKGIND